MAGSGGGSSSAPNKSPIVIDDTEEVETIDVDDEEDAEKAPPKYRYVVELAKSKRAECPRCEEKVDKNEIRIGMVTQGSWGPSTKWSHLKCTIFQVASAEQVEGYDELSAEHQALVTKRIKESQGQVDPDLQPIDPDDLVRTQWTKKQDEPDQLTASLLPFQKEGLAWMCHQEKSEYRGGIIADEMGMGKTIQTIALMLANRAKPADKSERKAWSALEESMEREPDASRRGKTLVVCPVIALLQWKAEIERFTEEGALTVAIHHGNKRSTDEDDLLDADVVLTTYSIIEAEFRKMTANEKVACPDCNRRLYPDKMIQHRKYFCGEKAIRTAAQSKTERRPKKRERKGGDADDDEQTSGKGKGGGGSSSGSGQTTKLPSSSRKAKAGSTAVKGTHADEDDDKDDEDDEEEQEGGETGTTTALPGNSRGKRKGKGKGKAPKAGEEKSGVKMTSIPARKGGGGRGGQGGSSGSGGGRGTGTTTMSPPAKSKAAAKKKKGKGKRKRAAEEEEEDSDSEGHGDSSSDISSEDSADDFETTSFSRKRDKGGQKKDNKKVKTTTLPKKGKGGETDKGMQKMKKRKSVKRKRKGGGRGGSSGGGGGGYDSNSDSSFEGGGSDDSDEEEEELDSEEDELTVKLYATMQAAGPPSVLHGVSWHRIVLDEAHYIKERSTSTAKATFALTSLYKWCLTGTPLQNRVGELYSLVRFLRVDPHAYYNCRKKGCDCKSLNYRFGLEGRSCEQCGHGKMMHSCYFNKHILNPIQRTGPIGEGKKAFLHLKQEVLDKVLLRRTKASRSEDICLPPRVVRVRSFRLDPVEEDLYKALYTRSKTQFNTYVDQGVILNNYAHIFACLSKLRQAVDHPYLVVHSSSSSEGGGEAASGGGYSGGAAEKDVDGDGAEPRDCAVCDSPAEDVLRARCGHFFCRGCVEELLAGMGDAGALECPACSEPLTVNLNEAPSAAATLVSPTGGGGARVRNEDEVVVPGLPDGMKLTSISKNSVISKVDLRSFQTSTKMEALMQALHDMQRKDPSAKAIVFSQFVNMLDLLEFRIKQGGIHCVKLSGGMSMDKRDVVLRAFREKPEVKVLLISLKAGGVALNLTVANYIFLMDPWWNGAAEMQAIDRTHRMGQTKPIFATRFIIEDTIEERIVRLQEKKRLVFDGTVGGSAASLAQLTVDDLRFLFQ